MTAASRRAVERLSRTPAERPLTQAERAAARAGFRDRIRRGTDAPDGPAREPQIHLPRPQDF